MWSSSCSPFFCLRSMKACFALKQVSSANGLPCVGKKTRKEKDKKKRSFFFFQSFLFGEPSQMLIGPRRGLSKRPSSYCLISLLKRCVSVLYTNCFLKVKEDLLGCCIKGEGGFILIRIWKKNRRGGRVLKRSTASCIPRRSPIQVLTGLNLA